MRASSSWRTRAAAHTPACFDLLGGTLEPGETNTETLTREIREETRQRLSGSSEPHHAGIHVTADSSGRTIDLRHRAWIAEVQVEGTLRHDIDDEDMNSIVLAEGPRSISWHRGRRGIAAVPLLSSSDDAPQQLSGHRCAGRCGLLLPPSRAAYRPRRVRGERGDPATRRPSGPATQ